MLMENRNEATISRELASTLHFCFDVTQTGRVHGVTIRAGTNCPHTQSESYAISDNQSDAPKEGTFPAELSWRERGEFWRCGPDAIGL
jgi:hypothetical protein